MRCNENKITTIRGESTGERGLFEKIINVLQEYKAQLIGFFISIQTMIMGYKDTCQKMKDRDTEDFMEVINDELGKIGI